MSNVISDESFKIASPLAKDALDTAVLVYSFISQVKNKEILNKHSLILYDMLKGCLSAKFKRTSYQRERMWFKYHQLRISKEYKLFWGKFVSETAGRTAHPIFYQHVGQTVFNSIIKDYYGPEQSCDTSDVVMALTYEEKNTLRYIGGSVRKSIQNKISKGKHPWKESLLIAVGDLSTEQLTVGDWITAVDRGGLFHINDVTYNLFQLKVRVVFRLDKMEGLNEGARSGLVRNIISDDDYWDSLMCND